MSDEGGEMPCMAHLVDDDGRIPDPPAPTTPAPAPPTSAVDPDNSASAH